MKKFSFIVAVLLLTIIAFAILVLPASQNAFQLMGIALIITIMSPLVVLHVLHTLVEDKKYHKRLATIYGIYSFLGILITIANISKGIDVGFLVMLLLPTVIFVLMWQIYEKSLG